MGWQPTRMWLAPVPEQTSKDSRLALLMEMFRRRAATGTSPPKSPVPNPADSPSPSKATLGDQRNTNGTIIADRYRLERTIGKGSYGKVKAALDLQGGGRVAIKFIARSSIRKPAHTVRIRREINLLTALHHPNIVGLQETVETAQDIVLVMEYVRGADLFERIVGHEGQRFPEAEARPLMEQIVAAIEYCHAHRVVHRDLKPENVMVNGEGRVKLIDFGFANMFHPRGFLETNCGSPLYAAPEIVQGIRYVGPEVDVWSLGVILFAVLTGTLPFEDDQLKGLYAKICAGNFTMPSYLSAGARDLIRSMLTLDVRQRYTISQVARHPWLRGFIPTLGLSVRTSFAPVQHPRADLLHRMIQFGFTDMEETRLTLHADPDAPASAIYQLLVEKEQREAVRTPQGLDLAAITPPDTPDKLVSADCQRAGLPPSPLAFEPSMAPNSLKSPWINIVNDLAAPVIMLPPMQTVPLPSEAGGEDEDGDKHGKGSLSIFSQAAASVANHFKKLRGISILPRTTLQSDADEFAQYYAP